MPERYIKVVEPEDNVGTFLRDANAGETVEIPVGDDVREVTLRDDIPFGHKVALSDIDERADVVKYGTSIGYASRDIRAGEWVHVDNVESNYGRGDLARDEGAQA
jgi:altronate dehydratase small subunit